MPRPEPRDIEHLPAAQWQVFTALAAIGGAAKAADIAYEMRRTPAYVTPILDNLHNLAVVDRGTEQPFPTYTIHT